MQCSIFAPTSSMENLADFFFAPYRNYSIWQIALESIAVVFGIWSVWLAKKNHVGVFPTGIVSTGLYVYLLIQWNLLGDMLINAYYTGMSLYGWWVWAKKTEGQAETPITRLNTNDRVKLTVLFMLSAGFVVWIYTYFDRWEGWVSKIDVFTTAVFYVAMWLMAKRKIAHWVFWIVGDIISVPLYFYKGYTLTSLQYLIFLGIALAGYFAWKKHLHNIPPTASE